MIYCLDFETCTQKCKHRPIITGEFTGAFLDHAHIEDCDKNMLQDKSKCDTLTTEAIVPHKTTSNKKGTKKNENTSKERKRAVKENNQG